MTTNERPAHNELIDVVTAPLIDILASDAMADSDVDLYELISSMHRLVPAPMFAHIALAFDMCPIHLTDLDTCADDDTLSDDDPEYASSLDVTIPLTACRHYRTR